MTFNLINLSQAKNIDFNLLLGGIFGISLTILNPASAQVINDSTLTTNVTTEDNRNFVVNDGEQAGNNLFHSFEQFSVPTDGSVFFDNSLAIQNIISRVTGLSTSNIDGLIQTNGAANLFLINPNGIVFGENAVLNIGGSLIATTAESLVFADGNEFSAKNNNSPPLLTISTPLGLQFGTRPGNIINRSQLLIPNPLDPSGATQTNIGLSVLPEKTLALLGGDILIDGGALTASNGNIELGSVAENNFVTLIATAKGWDIDYQNVSQFQDIKLDNLASVSTSGEGGGAIDIQGQQIKIFNGSSISSDTLGAIDGSNITINATEFVEITGSDPTNQQIDLSFASIGIFVPFPSQIAARTFGAGNASNISITAEQLLLVDGAQIQMQTIANPANPEQQTGESGNIIIQTTDLVELRGAKPLLGVTDNINELLPSVTDITNSAGINRFIETARSSRIDGSSGSNGNSGNIEIFTNQFKLKDGANIQNIPVSSGNAGNITINASELIEIIGDSSRSGNVASIITTGTFGLGNGGTIELSTSKLSLQNGGAVSGSTLGSGDGGDIVINAREIEIFGTAGNQELSSGLGSQTFTTGKAGNLIINTEKLNIRDRGRITVTGTSFGSSGNLEINANSIELNDRAVIEAGTASGTGGNIELNLAENLTLRRNSLISAQAIENADGGNVKINARFILARPFENSDILASAVNGDGGNINLTTQGIFGLSEGNSQPANLTNDLDASSDLGLSGTVAIRIPQFDPNQGLFDVTAEFIDINSLIQNSFCKISDNSSFIVTGRGGIPLVPERDFLGENTWEDWRVIETKIPEPEKIEENSETDSQINRELSSIQGWLVNRQGKVVLTANPLVVTPDSLTFNNPSCNN